MQTNIPFWLYLFVMAGVTYLIRMLPMVLLRKKIKNRYMLSFLYYMPYAVLTVMTIPAIFSSTESAVSAVVGFLAAVLLSYFGKSLVTVAALSSAFVFLTETLMKWL